MLQRLQKVNKKKGLKKWLTKHIVYFYILVLYVFSW